MNKKVSTIFAMAALAGGVFCGSAYAANINFPLGAAKTTVANGNAVLMVQGTTAVGFNQNSQSPNSIITNSTSDTAFPEENARNYTWAVRVTPADDTRDYPLYTFVNVVTGDTLSFNKTTLTPIIANTSVNPKVWAADGYYSFSFGAAGAEAAYAGNQVLVAEGTRTATEMAVDLANQQLVAVAGAPATYLHDLSLMSIKGSVLNALFNGKGFNLGVQPVLANVTVEDNLFGQDDRIWAFTVDSRYQLPASGTTGSDLYVPAGTYFFTDPVFNGGKGTVDVASPSDINWLASTLIALSPTTVGESTDSDRARGEGFKLVKVQGSDFIYESNTSVPQGEDIYISNACFTVQSNHNPNANYPYALSLNAFYYQETATYAGTTEQESTSVYLGVSSWDNSRQAVVSKTGTPTHIFNLSASSVVDGITLLNETKTPAIYTIKFVSGTNDDKDLMDKYLTVGLDANTNTFQWEAKGAAIADTEFPIFQYVITKAQKAGGDKYINVTFTNRETGKEFTTQLFPEAGTNRYSLLTSGISTVTPFTVNTVGANTYAVEAQDNVTFDSDIVVELTKLDNVDQYAGFLDVENESIRTLAFARDKNDTSNKFYSIVDADVISGPTANGHLAYDNVTNEDLFVDDITSAAQWQLIKGGAATMSRVYVYNNTATESVDDVPNGDKVSAYVYSLRYVTDGTETDLFLQNNYTTGAQTYDLLRIEDVEDASDITNNDARFIIKENVDGSVSLIRRAAAVTTNYMAAATVDNAIEANSNRDYIFSEDVYQSESDARNVKTYLDAQPIEISWPANEGHVTIESELGNYITMNENRDAIVVNENEADDYYLYVTDRNAIVPSFYITKGIAAENGERMFMFNPTDSVDYYVATGDYDRVYQWAPRTTKVMFKAATINETRDTLTMDVKGETKYVAKEADDNNADIWGGINRFKFQIIETEDGDGHYYIRQANANQNGYGRLLGNYLAAWNEKVTWSDKEHAMLFTVESVAAPTANEGVSATEVKIIATDGAINVKNAAGKNVVVSTILGQIVANEVLTSDNATISVPAGIVIVSVDGEEAVKVNVK